MVLCCLCITYGSSAFHVADYLFAFLSFLYVFICYLFLYLFLAFLFVCFFVCLYVFLACWNVLRQFHRCCPSEKVHSFPKISQTGLAAHIIQLCCFELVVPELGRMNLPRSAIFLFLFPGECTDESGPGGAVQPLGHPRTMKGTDSGIHWQECWQSLWHLM